MKIKKQQVASEIVTYLCWPRMTVTNSNRNARCNCATKILIMTIITIITVTDMV